MEHLLRRFDGPLQLAALVAVVMVVSAVVVARRHHGRGRPWSTPFLRLLAVGAVLVVLAATAYSPGQWSWGYHQVALGLGDGGLDDWRRLIAGQDSVVGWQFLLNVALYVPVGLLVALGWPSRRGVAAALRGVATAAVVSVGVELFQYQFADRISATDDVVLNSLGGAIGATLAWVTLRWRQRGDARVHVDRPVMPARARVDETVRG